MDIYRHQDECLESMTQNNNKGIVIIPTGGGKSKIEFKWAKSKLVREDGIHQIVVIVAPRIILCQQLIANFYRFMKDRGDVREMITFVSSGNIPTLEIDGKKVFSDNIGVRTTDPAVIRHLLRLADVNNKDSVIFSTYKSFDRTVAGIKRNIAGWEGATEVHLIADEAHCFTRSADDDFSFAKPFEALSENLDLFDTAFFLTATPKVKVDEETGSGMNNSSVYGDVVYEISPKETIRRGVICKPLLHSVITPPHINENNFDHYIGDIIYDSFLAHEKVINGGGNPERKKLLEGLGIRLGGKLLVAVNGSKQLNTIIKNGTIEKLRRKRINIAYTMSTKEIGTYFNGRKVKTDELLKELYKLCYRGGRTRYSTRLIVFHYDQLTEGIDVPVLTGMMPLREMNKIKKVQNIGRVLRALGEDQTIGVDNIDQWIKPYSYIVVPKIPNVSQFDALMDQLEGEYDSSCEIETSADPIGLDIEQMDLQGFEHQVKQFRSTSRDLRHNIQMLDEYKRKVIVNVHGGIDPRF